MKVINNTPNINIFIQQKFVLNDLRYHKNHFNLSTYILIYTPYICIKETCNELQRLSSIIHFTVSIYI